MRRPRLTYVVTHPVTADVLLRGQLAFMRERGFDVAVVGSPGPELDRVREREQVETIGVRMAREIDPRTDVTSLLHLTGAMRRLRPDIVNAGTPKAGLLGMLAARAARVPIRMYLLRGLRLETVQGPKRAVLATTERIASACAHDVACVSPSLLRLAVDGGFISGRKAIVIGHGASNGVDTARFARTDALRAEGGRRLGALGIRPEHKVVGFVGRFVAEKGVSELLSAWESVHAEQPDARLVLVGGDFADEALDTTLVAKVKAARGVLTTGRIADLAPYYARMDLLAFPSYREGFPNVPLEAAAAEVPTVGFRSTGVVDAVVSGQTGELVGKRDVAAFAGAMLGYLRDAERRAAHGRAARTRVEASFRREAVWGAWLDAYTARLARHRLPLPRP